MACNYEIVTYAPCEPQFRLHSGPMHLLSDEQLTEEIERACGEVTIGFKEAHQAIGPLTQGQKVSEETISRTIEFLGTRGVKVVDKGWQPVVAIHAQIPTSARIVGEIRRHPNIRYLETNSRIIVWEGSPALRAPTP